MLKFELKIVASEIRVKICEFYNLWTVAVWYSTLKDHENVLKTSSSFRGVIKTLDNVAADAFGTSFDRSAIKRKCAIQLESLWGAMTSHESRWKVITREKWLAVTPRPLLAVFEYYICLAFDRSCVLRSSFFAQSSFVLPIHYCLHFRNYEVLFHSTVVVFGSTKYVFLLQLLLHKNWCRKGTK